MKGKRNAYSGLFPRVSNQFTFWFIRRSLTQTQLLRPSLKENLQIQSDEPYNICVPTALISGYTHCVSERSLRGMYRLGAGVLFGGKTNLLDSKSNEKAAGDLES